MFTCSLPNHRPYLVRGALALCGLALVTSVSAAKPISVSKAQDPESLAPPRRESVTLTLQPEVQRLGIREVLSKALAVTPTLERQLSVIRQRGYEVEEAYTQANPKIDFQSQYQRIEPPVNLPTGGIINPANSYSFSLNIQQPIYTFGRLRFGVLASKLSRRSAQEEYLNQLHEVLLGGAELYIQAVVLQEAMSIAEDELEAQNANLRVTSLLFDQGVVAQFDVFRAQAATSQAQQELIEAETARQLALARLRSFMNLNPDQEIEIAELELVEPEDMSLPEEREKALELRPDLRALRWAREAAKARVDLARAQGSPTLSLQNQTVNRTPTGFSPGTQNTTSLVLSVPLFDGGVSKNRALQAEEVVAQLSADIEQRERQVRLDLEEAYRQLQDRWRSITVTQANVEQANEALRVAILRYKNGVSTMVELLDTQASRSRARFSLAQAKADYQLATWRWRRVAAQEFPVEVPLPAEIRQRLAEENR